MLAGHCCKSKFGLKACHSAHVPRSASGAVGSGGGGATSATLKEVRALLMAGSSRVTAEEIQRRQAKEK